MAVEIRVPPLGESLVDAVVGTWLKGEGDSVNRGETIVELETDKVNLDVTATELSPVALDKAARLAAQRGVSVDFALADALCWTYPEESFDLVVGVFIQFAAPDERRTLFENMKRTLKPGGRIVLQGYTPKQLDYRTGGPSAVENLYTGALLREAFGDLDIECLQEYEEVLAEGLAHRGQSALIGMLARKR